MPLNHLMLDLETLGISPDAVIASIGAVFFNPYTGEIGEKYYSNISIHSNLSMGRKIDAPTLKWWMSQDKTSQDELFASDAVHLKAALSDLKDFIEKHKGDKNVYVWSNGSNFDIILLENAYASIGWKPPWRYKDIRDVRTLVDLASHLVKFGDVEFEGTRHRAVDDAVHQARYVSTRWQALKKRRNTSKNGKIHGTEMPEMHSCENVTESSEALPSPECDV